MLELEHNGDVGEEEYTTYKILLVLTATTQDYLKECGVDYEDRWITREKMHQMMKELK